MKREKYHTEQKRIIDEKIKEIGGNFSIKDLYNSLIKDDKYIGLTTIYRVVSDLEKDGMINKFYKNNTAYYEYLDECHKSNHFYLKCSKCGKTIHVDCDCINDLANHMLDTHQFSLQENNLFMNGLCSKCKE